MATDHIPFDDLKAIATPFVKFADVLNERRPLMIAERRGVRWLLVAFEHAAGKFDKTSLAFHAPLLEKLRRVLATPEIEPSTIIDFTLDDLKDMTVPFLKFADALGRPLTQAERRGFRWLLNDFERPAIKQEFAAMGESVLPFYSHLIEQLRDVLMPDPVRQLRLHREKPERVGELCDGNFALKVRPMSGVSVKRLDHAEATHFVTLLAKLTDGIGVSVRVLSLVRQADRDEARQIVRAGKRIGVMARTFGAKCAPLRIPSVQSLEEITEACRQMGLLMKPAPREERREGGEEAA